MESPDLTPQQRLDLYIIKFMLLGTRDGDSWASLLRNSRYKPETLGQKTWDMLDRWLISDARK